MKSFFSIFIFCFLFILGCGSKEMNKAKEYMDAHMYSEAVSLLEIEIQANPKNVEAYYLAAQCYIELNNTYQSEEYFNKAILLDTDYGAKIGDYYYDKALKLYTESNYSHAESNYNKAVKYNPEGKNGFAQKLFDYATDISETATKANEVTSIYNFVTSIDNQFNEDIANKCANLSKNLYEKGFYEESFNYGEFSIRFDTGFINQLADLYESYAKKLLELPDKSNDAINYFNRSLKLNSSNRSKIANIFYDYSQKYESQNNAELTLLFAETCFNLDSKYEKYYNEIAVKYKPKYSIDGLLAYYPFNGNAYDESGNEKFCTVQGASLTTDRFNKISRAYYFENGDYMENNNFKNFSGNYTIAVWIKPSSINNYSQPVTVGLRSSNNVRITYDPKNQRVGFDAWLGGPTGVFSKKIIKSEQWTFVTGVRKNSDWKIYVDGVLDNTSKGSKDDIYNCIIRFGDFIGVYPFNGSIDDVRIYERALNDDEIKILYNDR